MKNKIASEIKKYLLHFFKFILAFGLIAYMLYTDKINLKTIYSVTNNIPLIVLAFFCILFAILINFYRWYLLLKGQGIYLKFKEVVSLNFIGLFFTTVLPGAVGGDLIKSVYIARKTPQKRTAAVLTVLLDRIVGLYALIFIGCIGLSINYNTFVQNNTLKALGITLYLILFCFTGFILLGLSNRIYENKIRTKLFEKLPFKNIFDKVYNAFYAYRQNHRMLTYAVLISFLTHAFNILSFYFITKALGFDDLSIYTYFFIVPVGMITTALPIAPAGIGIGQAAYLKLFEWSLGTPTSVGANAITVLQILSISIFLCGGFFYVTYKKQN